MSRHHHLNEEDEQLICFLCYSYPVLLIRMIIGMREIRVYQNTEQEFCKYQTLKGISPNDDVLPLLLNKVINTYHRKIFKVAMGVKMAERLKLPTFRFSAFVN